MRYVNFIPLTILVIWFFQAPTLVLSFLLGWFLPFSLLLRWGLTLNQHFSLNFSQQEKNIFKAWDQLPQKTQYHFAFSIIALLLINILLVLFTFTVLLPFFKKLLL